MLWHALQNPIGVFESSMSNASRMLYFMTEAKVLGVHLANTQILADLPLEISLVSATILSLLRSS